MCLAALPMTMLNAKIAIDPASALDSRVVTIPSRSSS